MRGWSSLGVLVVWLACQRAAPPPTAPTPPAEASSAEPEIADLAKLRGLPLEGVDGAIAIRTSRGFAARGTSIGGAIAEAIAFYRDRLGVEVRLELFVLDAADWGRITQLPYGLPFVTNGVVVMPAAGGVIAETFRGLETSAPPEIRARIDAHGTTWSRAVDDLVDLIGYHEAGHAFVKAYGLAPPTRWLDELLASYFAYGFMKAKRPALAATWDVMADALIATLQPAHRTLADFERLYFGVGVGNYAWYQQVFFQRVKSVHEASALEFLVAVKRTFLAQAPSRADDLVERLERIAPGFRAWASEL